MAIGVVGRKAGMTRIFTEDGQALPVTVIEVEPNRITQLKTLENDGYRAVQVTVGSDRKSTRLNSSQVRISYAVFCLKKKHKKQIATSSCTCTAPGSKHAARVVKARLAPALRVSPLLA